jgi:hypothetical protein
MRSIFRRFTTVAEIQLKSTSPSALSSQTKDAEKKADPAQNQELLAYLSSLQGEHVSVNEALSQMAMRQAEQATRAAAWAGVIHVLIVPSNLDPSVERRRFEELQNQLALILDEKKKQRKAIDGKESAIFEKLVSILGKPLAEQLVLKIDEAITGQGAALQKDPAAVAKLSAELLKLLSSGDTLLKLGISPQEVERVLQGTFTVLERSVVASQAAPANRPDVVSIGPDVLTSARGNPQLVAAHLQTQAGVELLRNYISSQSSLDARIEVIRALQATLGPERFAAVIDAYDRALGRPLVFDCLQLSIAAQDDQRKILQALLDPARSVLNLAQQERLTQFVISDAAAIVKTLAIEYRRIPNQIGGVERERMQSYAHMAEALGIGMPSGLSIDASHEQVLQAIAAKFPGLAGKSWEDVSKKLYELAGLKEADAFRALAQQLGVSLLPAGMDRAAFARLSPTEGASLLEREQQALKELAVRLVSHMGDISGHEQRLAELRAMLVQGPNHEETKLIARLESLYAAVLPGFTKERVESQGSASILYIDALQARINSTTDPVVLQGLCAERDSLEWRTLQLRIKALMDQTPPASEKVSTLLVEFNTAHAPGIRGRGAEFFQAAETALHAIQTTTQYFKQVEGAFKQELSKLSAEQVRLDQQLSSQKQHVEAQQTIVNEYMTIFSSEYQNDKKYLDDLLLAQQETERQLAQVEADTARVTEAQKQALAQQASRLGHIFSPGLHNLSVASPTDIAGHCVLAKESLQVKSELQAILLAADEARVKAQATLARLDLVGRAACTRREFAATASPTTMVIQQLMAHDRAMQPAPAALQALRAAVPAESAIGKALAALGNSSRPTRELIDLLFARLSAEDVMRVKAFLLAYDRPDLFELLGRSKPADAQGVWHAVAALQHTETSQELSQFLTALPQLRLLVDCESLLATMSESQKAEVLAEYKRIAASSLGQVLLAQSPASEPARSNFLYALCGSTLLTSDDLRSLFAGGVIPSSTADRQQAFAEALKRDSEIEFKLPTEFEELIQLQADERAGLQVALSAMIQMNRDEEVERIRRRLAELDSQFYRPLQTILSAFSADYVARTGIRERLEGARDAATQMAKISLLDPYGALAQDARKLAHVMQRTDVSSAQVVDFLRTSSPTPERMMMLEVMYLQYANSRASLGLSGDLRQDVAARQGSDEYSRAQCERLLQGDSDAVASYDLEMLSQGLRTKDPALTGRAILAIQGQAYGKETLRTAIENSPEMKRLWQEYIATPVSRETVALYNAVMTDDYARIGLIKTLNGLAWSMDKGFDAVISLGQYKEDVRRLGRNAWVSTEQMVQDIYGHSISQVVAGYVGEIPGAGAELWAEFLSSDAVAQTRAGVAFTKQVLRDASLDPASLDPALITNMIYSIPVEYRRQALQELGEFASKLDRSLVYQDGRSEAALIEYVRRMGGPTGEADALFLQAMVAGASQTGSQLPTDVLRRYEIERERLSMQLEDITHLADARKTTVNLAEEFRDTVSAMGNQAQVDLDGRMFGRGSAQALVDEHSRMLYSQNSLIQGMRLGVVDIETTKEVMRVRAVAILKDLTQGLDRGLSSEQNERDFGALQRRDIDREWAVARRDEVKAWQANSEAAQKALANFDWWFEVGHTTLKIAVMVGLGCVPGVGPGLVLAVATAWNAADKAYKVAYRGLSLREAARQFAVEFAIDALCAGAWRFAIRVPTPLYKHTAKFASNNVVAKYSKVLLGRLRGFNPKGQLVKPEAFKGIRGWFGQTRLASRVEKLTQRALTTGNSKIANPELLADQVTYMFKRIWVPIRPTGFAPLISQAINHFRPEPALPRLQGPNPLTGGSGVTPQRGASPNIQIPEIQIQAALHPSSDNVAALLERANRLGREDVADLAKQALGAMGAPDGKELLALVDGWLKDLGAKFQGQQAETPLRELKELAVGIREGAPDISALYPYLPAVIFLTGIPAGQSESPHQWKDYSNNFVLFDGMIDFLSPGWAGLWVSYKDNGSSFQPPPPPVQPPPPPHHKPSESGAGGGEGAGLALRVELEKERRKSSENVTARHESHAHTEGDTNTKKLAERDAEKQAERRADERVLAVIDQALQAQKSSAAHAQSISQKLDKVEQDAVRTALGQSLAAPTLKSAETHSSLQQQESVVSQLGTSKEARSTELAVSAVESTASASVQTILQSRRKDTTQDNEEAVMLTALRSKEEEAAADRAPKMLARRSEQPEEMKAQDAHQEIAVKPLSELDAREIVELQANSDARRMRTTATPEHDQVTAIRDTREEASLTRTLEAQRQVVRATHSATSGQKIVREGLAASIDSSALLHSDAVNTGSAGPASVGDNELQVIDRADSDEALNDSDSEVPAARRKKKKNKLQVREEARLRQIIMHQLLTQTLERSKRAKLLRMLAALGMTEQEYKGFLARLHAADAKREEAAKIQAAQKVALAVEAAPQMAAPTMKEHAPKGAVKSGSAPKTRAELFARLRNQNAGKIH